MIGWFLFGLWKSFRTKENSKGGPRGFSGAFYFKTCALLFCWGNPFWIYLAIAFEFLRQKAFEFSLDPPLKFSFVIQLFIIIFLTCDTLQQTGNDFAHYDWNYIFYPYSNCSLDDCEKFEKQKRRGRLAGQIAFSWSWWALC